VTASPLTLLALADKVIE